MTPEAAPLPELLQAKLQPLRELCERYGVEKLELFGSAARGEFDPAHSDLDFIVQMKGRREPGYARRFCDFVDALEDLCHSFGSAGPEDQAGEVPATGLPAEISELFPDSFEDSELGEIPSGWIFYRLAISLM
jgi:predicted nucleotidyltransferase